MPDQLRRRKNDQHLIDQDVTGGPWRLASNIEPLRRGTYIFCAWADPAEDSGLDPQACTSLTVHFGTQAPASRPRKRHRHPLAERPATATSSPRSTGCSRRARKPSTFTSTG